MNKESNVTSHVWVQNSLFPGLPTAQFLITCILLQAIKNWAVGRPGNKAR